MKSIEYNKKSWHIATNYGGLSEYTKIIGICGYVYQVFTGILAICAMIGVGVFFGYYLIIVPFTVFIDIMMFDIIISLNGYPPSVLVSFALYILITIGLLGMLILQLYYYI